MNTTKSLSSVLCSLTCVLLFASATTLPAQISGSPIDAAGGVKGKPTPTPSPTPRPPLDPNFIGATGANWSATSSWQGGVVPNNVGDAAFYDTVGGGGGNKTVVQDVVAGVTLGSLSLTGANNNSFTITLTRALTMNQDGAGVNSATISNSNSNTNATNFLSLSAGTLTLADDLLVSNTSGNTSANGSIRIASTIGGTGNITFSNNSNNVASGQITLSGTNNFTGSVSIAKGAVTFSAATPFGGVGNAVNLGSVSGGSATLVATTAGTGLVNNITVVSGSTGTLTLGSTSSSANTNSTFSGTLLLNDNVTLTSTIGAAAGNTGSLIFSNAITGVGGITKIGNGQVSFSNTGNAYQGDTTITAGTLKLGAANVIPDGSGKGNVSVTGTLDLNTFSETINGLSGAGTVDTIAGGTPTLTVGNNNQTSTFSGVIKNTAGTLALTKTGSGTLKLTNDNTYSGQTTVSNGTLEVNNTGTTGKLVNTTSIVVNNGGTLLLSGSASVTDRLNNGAGISLNGGATLRAAGVSEGTTGAAGFGMGALTLSGAAASVATIDFSGTSGILNFNGFSQTNNGSILNITNWVGKVAAEGGGGAEQLLFVGSASTFQTTFTQSEIEFDGTAGYRIVDHGTWFEVTAIPEPSTWVAAALAAAVIGYTLRRRFTRVLAGA